MVKNAGPKLSTRLLLLVALPLTCELVLLAGIGLLQYQTEVFARRLDKARLVLQEYNSGMLTVSRVLTSGMEAELDPSNSFVPEAIEEHRDFLTRLSRLEKLLEPNSPDLKVLKKIKALENLGLRTLMEYKRNSSFEARVRRQRPLMLINLMLHQFEELSKNAAQQVMEEQRRWETWRDFELKALIGGIIVSILASLALARNVHQKVISRLNVVMNNIDHLSAHRPLEAPLVGDDEIGKLDQMLRDTARKQAEAAQMKQDLVNTVTHDLRAPLTSQTLFLDLFSSGYFDDDQDGAKTQAQVLALDIKRLVGLVNNLLDAERMDSEKLEIYCKPVSIEDIVESAVASLQGLLLSTNIKLESDVTDVEIWADNQRTTQVVTNLVSNAINYAPQGSTIKIVGVSDASSYRVSIIDQGPGVPDDKIGMLFKRFQQVQGEDQRVIGSSGLGLSICKYLIDEQKGEIGYEHVENGGACFWFSLPLAETVRQADKSAV